MRWSIWTTGVTVIVTTWGVEEEARRIVAAELDAIERACSRFREDSELASVNASAGRQVTISPLFATALAAALRAAAITAGDVDPTVGGALRMAGYDRDFAATAGVDQAAPPARVQLTRVPGWRVVELDGERRTVRIPMGVTLDLGATAKALAADRAAHALSAALGCGALVAIGGDVAVAGSAPAGGWRIAIADSHATTPDPRVHPTISITSGAIATSSTMVRSWRSGERSAHHIIDPATGAPAGVVWRTVSVAAATCVDANTASTAAIVRGTDAPAWLSDSGLPARLVNVAGAVTRVAGWPADELSLAEAA